MEITEDVLDLLVIGAGMIGSSAAKYASEDSSKVCLVGPTEKGAKSENELFGAFYDEARITRLFDTSPIWLELAEQSVKRYRDIERDSGLEFYFEKGYLAVTTENDENLDKYRKTRSLLHGKGYECEELSKKEVEEKFPYFEVPDTGVAYYQRDHAGIINPRTLVKAQRKLAEANGCQLIDDVVDNVEGKLVNDSEVFAALLRSGKVVLAKKILVCTGAYTPFIPWLKTFSKEREIDLRLKGVTVAFFEVPENEARRLDTMPSLVTNYSYGNLDGTYVLPPVTYPDGKCYIKIGHHSNYDKEVHEIVELADWYKDGRGNPNSIEPMSTFLRTFIPNLKVKSIAQDCCVVSKTVSNRSPYIDEIAPGLGVAVGGCGYAAKSCDEIGRIAARLVQQNFWDTQIPKIELKVGWK